jgi:preprotein translocase subunit SecG
MRLIGLILSLGLVAWVLYQASGGDEAETAIPVGHQQALDKAKGVEQALMDATQKNLQELEKNEP